MAEPLEPIRPKPSTPPPLQRLWKSPPETDEVDTVVPAKGKKKKSQDEPEVGQARPKKKKKKVVEEFDDGTGATKLEETPVLDTYEARQRARWIIGGILGAIGLIALIVTVRAFKGNPAEEIVEGEPPPSRGTTEDRANSEREARFILDNAKQADRLGKTKAAVDSLNKLVKNYQGTAAAREAMHAIERDRLKKSLFGVDPPEQATGPKAPSSGSPMATGPVTPRPEGGATGADPAASKQAGGPTAPQVALATNPPVIPPKTLPRDFRPKSDAPVDPSGWPTRIICERDGAEMLLVPGGTFLIGREDGDPAERPAHRVTLSTYYIDEHEVTVGQYVKFLKETGRPLELARICPSPNTNDHPVVNISAREAKAFCNWAGRKLPTEAQWEMAARSPEGRISYWNGELPRKDPPKGPRQVEPVMSLPSDVSPYGAFDLAANAWEWTCEYYDSQYYQQFRGVAVDPTGPKQSPGKLVMVTVKGGSKSGILTWRDGLKIEMRTPYLGFRGALPVEGLPAAPPVAPPPSTGPGTQDGVVPF